MAKTMKGNRHAHGCMRCHTRYEDACETPKTDNLCIACRGYSPWQLLIDSAAPKDCCRQKSRLVTKDQRETYRLAGTQLWFICPECSRTHPFNPTRTP